MSELVDVARYAFLRKAKHQMGITGVLWQKDEQEESPVKIRHPLGSES